MGQLEFFKYVDEQLVILETENVKEAIKRCYVEAVKDSSSVSLVGGSNIVTIHEIVDTLPETDDYGTIILSREDFGIYQCNASGIPTLIQYFLPGMFGIMVGRDFDLSNTIFATKQFINTVLATPFDADSLTAVIALQWGVNTLILRKGAAASDIISFNNLPSEDYDIDRYVPEVLASLVIKTGCIFKNRLFVAGKNGEMLKLIKFEENTLTYTVYYAANLPDGLTTIDKMVVCGEKMYLIKNTGDFGTEKWYSYDFQKFTDVTPAGLSMKVIDVLPFNDGFVFIGENNSAIVAYHLTNDTFGDEFTIDVDFSKSTRFVTDGKTIFSTDSGIDAYSSIDTSFAVTKTEVDDTFYFVPFVSKQRVYAIAKTTEGDAVLYKSNPSTGLLEKSYTVGIDVSDVGVDVVACTAGIGTDDNVIISIDAVINFLKRKTNIVIK